jgi:hypothetical protein
MHPARRLLVALSLVFSACVGGSAGGHRPPPGTGDAGAGGSSEPTGGSGGYGGSGGTPTQVDSGAGRDATGDLARPDGAPDSASADAGPDVKPLPPPPPVNGVFRHPGVLVTAEQLAFVKEKIAAGAEPWTAAFNQARNSGGGSRTFQPSPKQVVECGPNSNPSNGCGEEAGDSHAAYTQALLWVFTGDETYARNAVAILNAWGKTFTGGHTNHNAPVQAGWYGAVFPRAAEIIRSTYSGWAAADIDRFKQMLRTSYLPNIAANTACANGNWEAVQIDALMAISVFLDDKAGFDKAVAMWRKRTPAYLYLSSDGPTPVAPPNCPRSGAGLVDYWSGESHFVDGLSQETCRDFFHTSMGIAAIVDVAETALIQGVDLYAAEAKRITAAFEFHAKYLDGAPIPSSLCGGKPDLKVRKTWEIGYNHYVNRLGMSLPQTQTLLQKIRPTDSIAHIVWETLTHADVGKVGLK